MPDVIPFHFVGEGDTPCPDVVHIDILGAPSLKHAVQPRVIVKLTLFVHDPQRTDLRNGDVQPIALGVDTNTGVTRFLPTEWKDGFTVVDTAAALDLLAPQPQSAPTGGWRLLSALPVPAPYVPREVLQDGE